jgi:hypothetical protein
MVNSRDYEFRWNEWNVDHIAEHGVAPAEAEHVVNFAARPYPERIGDGKYRVAGQTAQGRCLQVVYVFSPPGIVYVIHAMPLSDRDKRRDRRRRRGR